MYSMDYPSMWLSLVVGYLGFLTCLHHSEGACVFQGSLFANNTEWKPESCQDCTCHNDIVVCETTQCRDPQCDFTKGEVLRIEYNTCCPQCTSQSQGFCQHEGIIRAHETQWSQSECTECSCANSKVTCASKPCPPLTCKNGDIQHIPPGECCPICVGTGESCSLEGHLLRDGEQWKLSQCSRCICKNGFVECFTADCLPMLCEKDEMLAVVPGKCCPECLPKSCTVSGKTYEHGIQWKKNPCSTCMCDKGEVKCHIKTCYSSTCDKGQTKIRRPGQCCEECVSSKGSCMYGGSLRYHGELWNGSHCDFCTCDRGKVLCHKAQCAKVECSWGEELVHLDGKCCPECISSTSFCIYKEDTKKNTRSDLSGVKHFMNGEKWTEGPCRECECQSGQVICFSQSCPSCPIGTLAVDVVGECCPECQPVKCNLDCLTCFQSPEHCDICRDETRVLQMGRCVYSCGPGFYLDGKTCIACKEMCSSCQNGFECTSCKEPLLMKHGQCVTSCGDGYVQDQLTCTECHESCSVCQGPSESDCLMCKNVSQVNQGGQCTASCDNGFYVQNGTCTACDHSCQSCAADNGRCLTCAKGRVFHRGKCVLECPNGYYVNPAGFCSACHKECATCSGPLANQCTSCVPRFALLRGLCLRDCGESYYSDGSLCNACHPSCRSCVGPEDAHCTQCVNPEHVLQAEQDYRGKPYGTCQAQCKAQFYVDSIGVCRECHSSCSSCSGKSSLNCTACISPKKLYRGTCLNSCPQGFYSKEATCHMCHPSCKECSGSLEGDCLTCHPHAALIGGTCKTSCPDGQYLNLVGYCVDCHPQCQQCVANLQDTGSVCLKCQYSRYYFVGDRCLPECPAGYHPGGRTCKSCHPSCKTCSGPGLNSCISCNKGFILSHNGMCAQTCSQGYYRNGDICKVCESPCLTCDSAVGCTACRDPSKVLMFGECQYDICAPQYYLDYNSRMCKECDWSCNACKGPLRNDCLQCMEQYTLHAGTCVQHCSPSFYRLGESCHECEEHCLACSGPSECSQCEVPFYLLNGQCVRECGTQYQVSHYDRKCLVCPPGCLDCDDTNNCKLCDSKTFLKNHVCVSHCGHGYSGNPNNRRCEENVHAPVFLVNGSLTLAIGAVRPLDLSFMSVQDQNSEDASLTFHVVQAPTNGQLVKISRGKEVQLSKDTHFGMMELREQRVRFKHSKEKSRNGYFSLKVSDGQLYSQPIVINVQAVSAKPTYMLQNKVLTVGKGEAGAITSSELDLRDDDNPQDVVIIVLEAPRYGRLMIPPDTTPIHKFRLDDIRNGKLHYVHDGSESQSDMILFQANDGHNFQNILFHIKVNDKKSGGLQLVLNSAVWVPEGGMLQISNRLLQARAFGASDSQIVYTISNEAPKFGDIVLLGPMPADGPADGWQRLPDGRLATSVSSFTQQDINEGLVWYRHSGSQSQGRDSFSFQISSAAASQAPQDSHVFNIGILPSHPGAPQLSPGSSLHMTAFEDRLTVIGSHYLSFVDSESPSEKIVYNVTVPLQPNEGRLEHKDRPHSLVSYFTQADINQGKIVYRPPRAASHLSEIMDFSFMGLPETVNFFFKVSDGEFTTAEMPFTIHLLSSEQQPPVFQITSPFLEVTQGGRAPIGMQLAVSDTDTAPEDLFYELIETPRHGILIKSEAGIQAPMNAGDTFTYEDANRNAIYYVHDGSTISEDSMEIAVTDGIATSTTVVKVVVSLANDNGPRLVPGSLLAMTVTSRSSVVVTRSHLAYMDTNSPDSKIRIQLITLPMYGVLTKAASGQTAQELSEFSFFSMEDINNQNIKYSSIVETDSGTVTDLFHFTVYNADNNRLDNQMFTITITAAQQVFPVLSGNQILVEEGGRILLSTRYILATDSITSEKQMTVKIVSRPKFGYLENIKSGGQTSLGEQIGSDTFPVEDIIENNLYYVQSVHDNIEPSGDFFSFYMTDGSSQSEVYNISIAIQGKNDERPQISVLPLRVQDNAGAVIRNTCLSVQDMDTPDNELLFTVMKKPAHGNLHRRQFYSEPLENGRVLSLGSSFTYQDVLDELIVYIPVSVEVLSDEFRFSLSDGHYTETGRLEVSIEPKRKEPPRLAINRGLQISAGSIATITDQYLKGTDSDSDDAKLRYFLKKDPAVGRLHMSKNNNLVQISVRGPVTSFTQMDVNKGYVQYKHEKGESGGSFAFKFDVVDSEENKLIDQSFYISILEDKLPPSITANKGLTLDENSVKKITTLQLSATDQDSEPRELLFRINKQPALGHLEHAGSPGVKISSFSQADLESRNIQYIHTSAEEKHSDEFTFTVSDGVNEVSQTFYITINKVDDSLPVVQNSGMRVQEGVRKTITEFELKAVDADTEAESVTFTIVQPPRYGTIERSINGQNYRQTTTFTMDDIYQNRISYNHDGSNTLKDRFSFTVSDGTNPFFIVEEGEKEIITAAPQRFKVDILPVDDGTPRIVTNLGLQWLEYMDGRATNIISKKELMTMDPDTEDKQLVYEISSGPYHGFLENKLKPGRPLTYFTQEDINLGLIRYILHEEKIKETMDNFKFLVKDSKPNVVSDNVFHIQWCLISFKHTSYNVSEKAGSISVTVHRTGNLNQYAIVLCRTEQGTATSSSSVGSRPGQQDYVEYAGQVQFDEREDTKTCNIIISDDQVYENIEEFTVELSMPAYALLGNITKATVNINDTEDEPTLQFDKKIYRVKESAGLLSAPIERKGDSGSIVSAICYTVPKSAKGSSLYALESGSDFKSRAMSNENRVIFGPGVTMSTCDVKLVDDSEYEDEEEFEIALADTSQNARIGNIASAKVVIEGPNDASTVFLGNETFTVSEDAGTIEIPVIRNGPDLSVPTSVWCATRPSDPPSATPGIDYIPSSKKIEFRPGKTVEHCTLTIMDDTQHPVIEGLETFVVFLSSAQGAELTKPFQAMVAINDTFQDVPSMQFSKDVFTVKEKDGAVHVPVIRTGDLSFESSVRCYTQSQTAQVMDDFEERRNSDDSRITFLKGDKMKNCSVFINDDSVFEPEEQFKIYLGHPLGNHWSGARIGKNDMATVTITNDEDAPTIEFEEATYQIREPQGPEGIAVLNIKVIRKGDQNRTSKVRCSTRDGSAQSGVDYYPKSRVLKFSPGMDHIMFKVEILSNEDREWHESFSLVLGPDDPVEAVLGDITTATVTILDQEAAGSLILPAPPIVVSLADYDHVEEVTKEGVKKSPSPGYPLVCVTPCDPHFPKYSVMRERCEEAGINQSTVMFSWEVAAPTDSNGARSPFETITDTTPFTSVNQMVLDSIYFSRRFHVRCVAKAVDKAGHVGTPLRSNIVTIGTDSAICHTPVVAGTARGFQAQSFIATLKYLDVKHKEHPNRIHISVQIPHQDGMLPLISTMPLHNLHFLLSESVYRHQHVCSNLVTVRDLRGISEAGFLDEVTYDSIAVGPGYDRPYQFDPNVREPKTVQLYKHLNLKSCIWTFDAYYDMTELIDVCSGAVTADFQVRDSAQSFLTVHVPLYVSYIYVTAPRGWASLEHHTEMEFSFFYDTVLWRTGIQTDSVLSARLQIIRIYIREDGRLVIEFKTHAKFRGQFVMEHHTLPDVKSHIMAPDHLGGIEFDLQPLWSAQTFDSPYQLWRATSSYSRKDYSGEYTIYLIPCTVQPTQPWTDPGDKPLACTAHAPERFLIPIAFQQTNRPVPVVYSLNTEFQLCNNEKVFLMDPTKTEMSLAEMDYKGAFSMGQTLYGRVLWNPDQNLNSAYKLQLEKVYLCTGKDGYVPFFDPTGTIYNEGTQYGCIQPNKLLKHRFLLLDRNQPEVTDKYFHDVPFEAYFASESPDFHAMSSMPGVDGFTMKVDALYKVEAGHQWYLQVIYIIGPETMAGPRVQRSLTYQLRRDRRDLVDKNGRLTLDDSLIYDNEGDQVKNGTNMKTLNLETEVAASSSSQTGASIGSAFAAIMLLMLVLLAVCLITQKCRRRKKKMPNMDVVEEYPLNTKVEASRKNIERAEKNFNRQHCTVRNINLLEDDKDSYEIKGVKVKKVNLEVKVHNNLHDGTEV
ncbi:LOW QUALITY PROTEIN: extracellular matrix organizing protein FRAS1 [Bombina bombina]|uniref:LOW QUALITY PROTEIN: extracellular matrix organizing protein FRAS1 n=1 Tax=Bombina bombina TaxID=8345 RepID=UPI00235A7D49|nr:LOW QUALITY PROTEIN: extracellular matrix organizing protein FRAS1 [Bombina bombina]